MTVDITTTKSYLTLSTVTSTDAQWLTWVNLVSGRYGKSSARTLFSELWVKRGSDKANTLALRTTLKNDYQIQINESIWNEIVDLGGSLSSSISSVFKTGEYLTFGIIGVGALALIGIITGALSKPKATNFIR